MQSLFPNAAQLKPQKLVRDGLAQNKSNGNVNVKPTQKAIKSATKHIYSKINVSFQKVFKVSFAEAQTKVKELELQKKNDAIEKKRERRKRARQEKNKIQAEWSKRDCDVMLATRQSLSQRSKQRKLLHFESATDAAIRVQKRKNQEDLGERKRKRHSPPTASVEFDKENLLMEEGVDLERFQQFRKRPAKARRKLNRTYGGEITVPTPCFDVSTKMCSDQMV